MKGGPAAAAAAHKRVKRALGLLRGAAALLAPDAGELDLVAEVRVADSGDDLQALLELVRLAVHRHGPLDVVVFSQPRPLPQPAHNSGDA